MEPTQHYQPVTQEAHPPQPVQRVQLVRLMRGVTPTWTAFRASQLVYLVFGAVEVLIATRVILMLLGANAGAGFTSFIYGVTAPFLAFFQGVFPTPRGNGSMLDISSLLAIAVYALLAWAIVRVIQMIAERRQPTATA